MNYSGSTPLLPGSTIGILGSGQLGRMLAGAARTMGYRVHVLSPGTDTPTGHLADREVTAAYQDLAAVRDFARQVDVVTYEFENVPAATADACAQIVPLRPGAHVLHVAQSRVREKQFFAANSLPVAPFAPVRTPTELDTALATVGVPAVLKTDSSGYDGKGQVIIEKVVDGAAGWEKLGNAPAILEAFVPFQCELSVVSGRGLDGTVVHYGAIENDHANHILDVSTAPARVPPPTAAKAVALARTVMERLDVIGVLCVEFFLAQNGELLLNEIAPRPHNSGHLTIEGCITSQFEQQLRAVCGLPLGDTRYLQPVAMANLLGDLWANGAPDWAALLADPAVKLHLYGKAEARPGRKMGHITALAGTASEAEALVRRARAAL